MSLNDLIEIVRDIKTMDKEIKEMADYNQRPYDFKSDKDYPVVIT